MTPEYLEHLANLADPGELWRLPPFDELTLEQSQQRDTGVALRRYASHLRRLSSLRGTGYSLLITPLSPNTARTSSWPTPEQHKRRGALSDPDAS